jgi:chromosome segregation protein
MYLAEIVINGFKSFADRTRFDLQPGVIAIVGPNGCGKSNIADAIRWVLGEQSAKALRGGKMQDVIFEGADNRKALNLCQVTLKFTDCEDQLGTAFNEVEIGRRVSRDGQSEYLLNGKVCRLKDIQRLFMDTGVGRVSYSFLVQGQIDQILSTNPADRRVIFEEAAGITRYKAQRRETMNKLALVETNLSRVTDVIEEVARQIGSLKRQASKALRYKRIKHRLTHLELALLSHQNGNFQLEIDDLEKDQGGLTQSLEVSRSATAEREAKLEKERDSRQELYDRMQKAQQEVYNLRSEKENAENKMEFAALRRDDLESRIEELRGEIAGLNEQRDHLARQAADDTQVKQMQLDLVGSSDEVFQEKNQELFEAQEQLNRAENLLQDSKQQRVNLESSLSRLRANLTSLEVDLKTYQVKHAGLKDFLQELTNKREDLEQMLEDIQGAARQRKEEHDSQEAVIREARAAADALREGFRDLQVEIQEGDRQIARKAAHLQVLENLNESFEGFGEGTRAILQNKLDDLLPSGRRALFTETLQVEEAYTGAIESLLGAARDTIVVEEMASADAVMEALKTRKIGRACLRVPPPSGAKRDLGGAGSRADLPEGFRRATDLVTVKSTGLEPAARSLFDSCYVVDSLESFFQFWQENPNFSFYRVATLEGALVDFNGLVWGGYTASGQDSYLKRQNEIRAIKADLEKAHQALDQLRAKAADLQEQMDRGEESLEQARQRQVEIDKELSTLGVQEKGVQENLFQNEAQQASTRQQLEALEESHEVSERKLTGAREELEGAEAEIEACKAAIQKGETQVQARREERDARREGLADVRFQLAEKKQRLDAIDRNLAALEEKGAEIHELLQRREQEIGSLQEQVEERNQEEAEERSRAEAVTKALAARMEVLDQDRGAFEKLENEVKALEKELAATRETERQQETAVNRFEVKLTQLRSKQGYLLERIREEYQVSVDSIDWKQELWKADEEFEKRINLDALEEGEELEAKPKKPRGEATEEDLAGLDQTDWDEVEDEVKSLKDRIQSMGPVNLVAIEEYADLSQRYKFLKEQSDDLWNSKNKLIAAIDEINQVSEDLFRETFEQVTKNFKYTYDQLTGGGFADLTLVDKEDVLDSGIEIVARPPGTKLKSISLLSGGQKTMTAVALLFAIYMVKPSPFCVLDELDAPLDDANIGRFTEMLKRFTEYSQFLIITHNKRTIAEATAIFGVTMPEKGVSRLISMRFDHEKGKAEAVPEGEEALAG